MSLTVGLTLQVLVRTATEGHFSHTVGEVEEITFQILSSVSSSTKYCHLVKNNNF